MNQPPSHPRHDPPPAHPIDPARWLSTLPDDLPICDINIPGSHNAAAISTQKPTRWACQCHSITEQLRKGIRLLDIRLKPKRRHDTYEFITCHGHLGPFGANEFQSLESLFEECTAFLKGSPREAIIMTIQIDDWRRTRTEDRPQILKTLQASLTCLPLLLTPKMPTLKDCRGHIFLINRINEDPALGVPIDIPDNTPGTTIEPTATRNYEVYIQDQYKKLNKRDPEAHKFHLTIAAFEHKRKGAMLLNFASGTKPFGRFVYIMQELSAYLASQAVNTQTKPNAQTKRLGWVFIDYPFTENPQAPDLPALIISSNYHS